MCCHFPPTSDPGVIYLNCLYIIGCCPSVPVLYHTFICAHPCQMIKKSICAHPCQMPFCYIIYIQIHTCSSVSNAILLCYLYLSSTWSGFVCQKTMNMRMTLRHRSSKRGQLFYIMPWDGWSYMGSGYQCTLGSGQKHNKFIIVNLSFCIISYEYYYSIV